MPRCTFNESEIYLLKNWASACRLEEAMDRVRHEKYHAIILKTAEFLVEQLGTTEYRQEVWVTQRWGDGFIYFWADKWGKSVGETREVPYFCLGGLRLESLLSDSNDTGPPYACVYTKYLRKVGWDLSRFRNKLESSATRILKTFPKRSDEEESTPICYCLPEGRAELRRLLLEDEEGFTKVLTSHGMQLADLAPIISQILEGKKQ
jgi:hypothetical protein